MSNILVNASAAKVDAVGPFNMVLYRMEILAW